MSFVKFLQDSSLQKQPFFTARFQFFTAHFVHHCMLKQVLPWCKDCTSPRFKSQR